MRSAARTFYLAVFALFISAHAGTNDAGQSSPYSPHACAIDPKATVSDTCASYATLDTMNDQIHPLLQSLTRDTDFFSYYRLNLFNKACPFWSDENSMCGNIACSVNTIDSEEDIPPVWRVEELSRLEGPKAGHPGRQQQEERPKTRPLQGMLGEEVGESCVVEYDDECDERDYCVPEDEGATAKGDYVSLVDNPERFTGYAGPGAHQVWNAIYQENCFLKPLAQSLTPFSPLQGLEVQAANDFRSVLHKDLQHLPLDNECLEKRVFHRIISGMHASISTHICWEYFNQTTEEWGPNVQCYKDRLHNHPERISNLYFNYALVSRAVAKLHKYLQEYEFCSFDPEQDIDTRTKVLALTEQLVSRPQIFDETAMFQDPTSVGLKEDFRNRFRNVSRLMDCIGCDKCRLWGKLQVNGYGTALKVLFEYDESENGENPPLRRTELVALINTLARISNSLAAVRSFRNAVESGHEDRIVIHPAVSSSPGKRSSDSSDAKPLRFYKDGGSTFYVEEDEDDFGYEDDELPWEQRMETDNVMDSIKQEFLVVWRTYLWVLKSWLNIPKLVRKGEAFHGLYLPSIGNFVVLGMLYVADAATHMTRVINHMRAWAVFSATGPASSSSASPQPLFPASLPSSAIRSFSSPCPLRLVHSSSRPSRRALIHPEGSTRLLDARRLLRRARGDSMASVSPPKPWERAGAGATAGSPLAAAPASSNSSSTNTSTAVAPATPSSPSSTTPSSSNSGSSTPPNLPSRPSSLNAVVNRTASNYSPYGASRFGASPYGAYGAYGSYSSPYSRFGSMYGGYGGYGGMYGGMGGMYGGMPGDPNDPNSLTHSFSQSTAATFQMIESIVGAFGGFAQMLESTYMATHSSFFAMVSVAEQFGHLRNTLGSVLGIYTMIRWVKTLIAKLTGRPLPADATSLTPSAFSAFLQGRSAPATLPDGSPAPPRPSRKPFVMFLLAVFGLPYLMGKLIRALARSQEEEARRQQLLMGPNGEQQVTPLDPSKLDFCRVLYDYTPDAQNTAGIDLEVKKGDIVAVLSKSDPMGNPSEWWRCRARDGRVGYLPSPYLETIQRRPTPAAITAGSSASSSRTATLTNKGAEQARSQSLSTTDKTKGEESKPEIKSKMGDIAPESFQKGTFYP